MESVFFLGKRAKQTEIFKYLKCKKGLILCVLDEPHVRHVPLCDDTHKVVQTDCRWLYCKYFKEKCVPILPVYKIFQL